MNRPNEITLSFHDSAGWQAAWVYACLTNDEELRKHLISITPEKTNDRPRGDPVQD